MTGAAPAFTATPGVLIDSAPEDVAWGVRRRASAYDTLLRQLKAAGEGKFLEFSNTRARTSIDRRAKKLKIKIRFGTRGETLYVSLAKAEQPTTSAAKEAEPKVSSTDLPKVSSTDLPKVSSAEAPKVSNAELVLRALDGAKRYTAGDILVWMRANGAPDIGISQIDGLLGNLARANKVRLASTRPSGSNDISERWTKV